ncbi:MAG TPA: cofactor-independent phosphoglycerate mutase [Candidatus Anaerotruncus excrementipullorum]|uniref:Cofactor-independent phosphoglycerate mutase n=1 Tax=Candidatus Anaerotruncus excrementipullorum TaxID=2838465 RepID=A0A9D1WQM1_9FIRM|nr:cofactor-independent phosphoglycerate mutase [Candidatus Anaerotruncus excrementipullorum]
MRYLVILGDGMADRPVPELGGRTPLEAAHKPHMDWLAQHGEVGMARTVPEGMPPGSDTANLSVMGYDPRTCYSGRSPLEAVSMGIPLAEDDVTFRCNLVTLSEEEAYEDCTMVDYSSDEITTRESSQLIHDLNQAFHTENRDLFPGISYRHCLVLHHAKTGSLCTPPHDISGRPIRDHLPGGTYGAQLLELMKRSREILRSHPVNLDRIARGLRPATSCWFWGEGTRPAIQNFTEKYGVKGGVISAVDLIKGIAICAGLESVDVPGATGTVHTNFPGKAQAAIDLFRRGAQFVYIHMEAPDECGHRHEVENKVKSIELIDSQVVGPVLEALQADGEPFSVLVMPDHPTPLDIRTHSADPVPFVLWRSGRQGAHPAPRYTEAEGERTGLFVPQGCRMMDWLIKEEKI